MSDSNNHSNWARLFRVACGLIRQVNAEAQVIDRWTLGGGTALMLQIDHRESHDVDIFLQDPQLLPFLDPQKHDLGIGEIDFIVAQPKTTNPTIQKQVEGTNTLLETVPEIIAKKIVYRGSSIQPRDIFDIAAAGERVSNSVVAALRSYKSEVAETLKTLERLNPEFVHNSIAQLLIKPAFAGIAEAALERTKQILRSV